MLLSYHEFLDSLQEAISDVSILGQASAEKNKRTDDKTYGQVLNKDISDFDIEKVLREVNGNKTKAAEILGVSRMTLWRRLKKINL